MVRVISCHHFVSQDVFISEQEPSALGCAQGKLLFATTLHSIEVRDLDARGNILHSFPTIDDVKQLVYCDTGNYIATLECKTSRHSESVTFVRIYFNWWVDVKGQAMRVRIAGGATSSDHCESGGFEMVELPLEKTALSIACCKKTAGLAVSLGSNISVFCFRAKTQGISKCKFYDFDHFLNIQMSFVVEELNMCEGYFACVARNKMQVFRVCFEKQDNENVFSDQKDIKADSRNFTSSCKISDTTYLEWKFESYDTNSASSVESKEQIKSFLHADSFPLSIHIPAIERAKQDNVSLGNFEIHGPLLAGRGHNVEVGMDSTIFEICPSLVSMNIKCYTLLYKQILTGENQFWVSGLHLIPLYQSDYLLNEYLDPLKAASSISERELFSLPWSPLTSNAYPYLKSVCCFFTTSQEGFLYDVTSTVKMLCSYPYTAPLKSVVLEPALLHALTDAGLETYTLRVGHCAIQHSEDLDQLKNATPSYEESICLLGLRPFLGIDHLIMCENYIVLVSSSDDSLSNSGSSENCSCTLYSLKRPSPEQLFADLLEVGQFHKNSSPATYLHLLSEAHMMLRTYLFINKHNQLLLRELYEKSCTMMADYFVSASDLMSEKHLAVPYYFMGKLPVEMVLQRILEFHHQGKHSGTLKVLVRYLNLVLLTSEFLSSLPLPQATAETVLDVYAEDAPELLWKVILLSGLQGYRIEKAILLLKRRITGKHSHSTPVCNAADTVAIVILLLQKGNYEAAQSMILSVSKVDLLQVLLDVCQLALIDDHLSSFGQFLKQVRPDIFLELFLHLTEKGKLQLHDVIQFLQEESCTVDIFMVPLLKEFLETYISGKKFCAENNTACIIILVDIYLNRLREPRKGSMKSYMTVTSAAKSTSLFGTRAPWFDEMPPFKGKGISKVCINHILKSENNCDACCTCWTCNEDLLKLQSLLTWQQSSTAVTEHVVDFLKSLKTRIRGHLSLEVMCSNVSEALSVLLKSCPTAVLPYAHSTFGRKSKNWYLLFSLIADHIINCSLDNDHLMKNYGQIFHGVMNYMSETVEPPALISLIQDHENLKFTYTSHIKRCCEKQQAEQLKNKIVSLGKEIKEMM